MECNKEEANRAKGIAENKMQNNDFAGARKFALRAQQLYSELDNISQMIMVCDVHCSAEKKLGGNEMDWYGILQIEQTADEAIIKKQYRKFALQLHPDKNKFPGAETAFKTIGEAQRVLLDQGKRTLHDLKRKASVSRPVAPRHHVQKPPWQSNAGTQNNIRSNFTGLNSQHQKPQQQSNIGTQNNFSSNFTGLNSQHQKPQQPAQPAVGSVGNTFWTMCPFCTVKYQYYRDSINKCLLCQTCKKPFIAYERGVHGVPTATNFGQPAFSQQKDIPYQSACKVEQVFKGNFTADNSKKVFSQKAGCTSDVGKEKIGKRGRKQVVESSESFDTESSSDSEVDMPIADSGNTKAGDRRRSNRHKQHVSYNENLSDDDLVSHPKRAKASGSSCAFEKESGDVLKEKVPEIVKQSGSAAAVKEELKEAKQNEESLSNGDKGDREKSSGAHSDNREKISEASADSKTDSSSKSVESPVIYDYFDPDFSDFDKDRKEECFMVGQMWAAYDTVDAMPRFYARIRKVFPTGFKLRITWLEPDPDDEKEIEWANQGLPVSCGKFKHGNSEDTEDRLMFSHLVSWERGNHRDAYKIFPRKGEIWALFKGWDFKWKSDANTQRKYEYEFVEILSDYTEGEGICVSYLTKVKGFTSVFCRNCEEGMAWFRIPPGELLRFSHMVPSVTLTGEEGEGVPKGSFELDPASLPPEYQAEAEMKETRPDPEDHKLGDDDVKHRDTPPAPIPEKVIEIPTTEFHNFDEDKFYGKWQVGQIWSLYSDEDGLPRYLGQVTKVEYNPAFKVYLRWLVPCSQPKSIIQWHDEKMTFCCGRFKAVKAHAQYYTSIFPFSHPVRAVPTGKKDEYTIFPRKGEVWALYKNWTAEMKPSDLEKCEYELVEVREANDLQIDVIFLERVENFKSVFRRQVKDLSNVGTKISMAEVLKFSHQIPAYRIPTSLLREHGIDCLKGWELDPGALPAQYTMS